MKVVYNDRYGGFRLSEKALRMIAELEGFDLTGCLYSSLGFFKDGKYNYSYLHHVNNLERTNGNLVKVVETLGEEANSGSASLKIQEIPDDAEFEIDNYDGWEEVVPKRPFW